MNAYTLGVMFGILVAVLIVTILSLVKRRKTGRPDEFDERQQLIRGRAYQHAFIVTLCVAALYGGLVAITERAYMADGVAALLVTFIGVGTFGAESILRDAFFTAKNRPKSYIILYAAVIFSQLVNAVSNIREGGLVQDGVLTMKVLPLACTVLFTVILVCLVVKAVQKPKEDDE